MKCRESSIFMQFLCRLHKTQDLLYDSTKDFLEQRYAGRADERVWMGEKDKLLQQLDRTKSQMHASQRQQRAHDMFPDHDHDGRTANAEEIKVSRCQKMLQIFFSSNEFGCCVEILV